MVYKLYGLSTDTNTVPILRFSYVDHPHIYYTALSLSPLANAVARGGMDLLIVSLRSRKIDYFSSAWIQLNS